MFYKCRCASGLYSWFLAVHGLCCNIRLFADDTIVLLSITVQRLLILTVSINGPVHGPSENRKCYFLPKTVRQAHPNLCFDPNCSVASGKQSQTHGCFLMEWPYYSYSRQRLGNARTSTFLSMSPSSVYLYYMPTSRIRRRTTALTIWKLNSNLSKMNEEMMPQSIVVSIKCTDLFDIRNTQNLPLIQGRVL